MSRHKRSFQSAVDVRREVHVFGMAVVFDNVN